MSLAEDRVQGLSERNLVMFYEVVFLMSWLHYRAFIDDDFSKGKNAEHTQDVPIRNGRTRILKLRSNVNLAGWRLILDLLIPLPVFSDSSVLSCSVSYY